MCIVQSLLAEWGERKKFSNGVYRICEKKKKSKREKRRKNIAYILVMNLPKLDSKSVGKELITMSKEDYAHKPFCIKSRPNESSIVEKI